MMALNRLNVVENIARVVMRRGSKWISSDWSRNTACGAAPPAEKRCVVRIATGASRDVSQPRCRDSVDAGTERERIGAGVHHVETIEFQVAHR